MSLTLNDLQAKVSLKPHTSWLVGGPAEFFYEPRSIDELREVQILALNNNLNVTILGGGTNVLINDAGVEGLVISLSKFTGMTNESDDRDLKVWALAGTTKSELLKFFLKNKSQAACFLAGLPGQVGGGVVMNAGVGEKLTPREFCEITSHVEVLRPDGRFEILEAGKLNWSYRHCVGWQPGIITRVQIKWPNKPDAGVLTQVKELNHRRLLKQPLEWPSCGSVFRNPLPQHAGALIEAAGLKGHTIGGAQVSEKHANFIINKGAATADDIRNLIYFSIEKVREKSGVTLQTEVVFL